MWQLRVILQESANFAGLRTRMLSIHLQVHTQVLSIMYPTKSFFRLLSFSLVALLTLFPFEPAIICAQAQTFTHRVAAGETLYQIARFYGTTIEQILALNPGIQPNLIELGSKLRVPEPTIPPCETKVPPKPKVKLITYKVKRKDTLYSIAKNHQTTIEELEEYNPAIKEEGFVLKKGIKLQVPIKDEASTPPPCGLTTIKVAVVLPFVGKNVEHLRSIEFYRGFLMGLAPLKDKGLNVVVNAYTEPALNEGIANVASSILTESPDLIIGPVYPSHFDAITALAGAKCKVVIPFSSKVPAGNLRSNVYLLNTPASYESLLAEKILLATTKKDAHLLMLNCQSPDRAAFTSSIQAAWIKAGRNYSTMNITQTATEFAQKLKGVKTSHVYILTNSAQAALLPDLAQKCEDLRKALAGVPVSLIGHESWQAESETDKRLYLHKADCYLMTPAYFYPHTTANSQFTTEYTQLFKTNLLTSAPRMAPLGYDFAGAMLSGMAKYGHDFTTQRLTGLPYANPNLLQSQIQFIPANESGGYVNSSYWLIHFRPDLSITKLSASN